MESLADKYGLNSRIKLLQINESHIGIIKQISSRIIQKDAIKIVEFANVIRNHDPKVKVSLVCNPNICSKSLKLLAENKVEVLYGL